jgi:integrase
MSDEYQTTLPCAPRPDRGTTVMASGARPVSRKARRAGEKARTEVGIPEIHLRDLRHLAGNLAASTGASTKEVMYRLGHATHQAALRYQHATRQRDRSIADALDDLVGDRRRSASTR